MCDWRERCPPFQLGGGATKQGERHSAAFAGRIVPIPTGVRGAAVTRQAVDFSEDGKYFVTCGQQLVKFWSAHTPPACPPARRRQHRTRPGAPRQGHDPFRRRPAEREEDQGGRAAHRGQERYLRGPSGRLVRTCLLLVSANGTLSGLQMSAPWREASVDGRGGANVARS